jgi:hypothetical protein
MSTQTKPTKRVRGQNGTFVSTVDATRNDKPAPGPTRLEGETEADLEKRLAKRKALTLKVFQTAYESHRRRKAS